MTQKNALFVMFALIISCIAMDNFASQNTETEDFLSPLAKKYRSLFFGIENQIKPSDCKAEIEKLKSELPSNTSLGDLILDSEKKVTLLMYAAADCAVEWVEYLIANDCTVSLKDVNGKTAFNYVEKYENVMKVRENNPLRYNSKLAQSNAERIMTLLIAKEAAERLHDAVATVQQKAYAPRIINILTQSAPYPKRHKTSTSGSDSKKVSETQELFTPQNAALYSQAIEAAVRRMPDQNVFAALAGGIAEVFGNKSNAHANAKAHAVAASKAAPDNKKAEEIQAEAVQSSYAYSKNNKTSANPPVTARPLTAEQKKERAKRDRREQRDALLAAQAAAAALEREQEEATRAREEKAASESHIQEQVASMQSANNPLTADESPALEKEKRSRPKTGIKTISRNQQHWQREKHHQQRAHREAAAASFETLKTLVLPEAATSKSKPKSHKQLEQEAEQEAEREAIRLVGVTLAEQEHQKPMIPKAVQFHNDRLKLKALKAMNIKATMNKHDAKTADELNRKNIQRDFFMQLKLAKTLSAAKKAAEEKEYAEMNQKAADFSVWLNQEQEKEQRAKDQVRASIKFALNYAASDWHHHHNIFLNLPLEPTRSAVLNPSAEVYFTDNASMLQTPSIAK